MRHKLIKFLLCNIYNLLFGALVYAGISVTPGRIETVVLQEKENVQIIKVINTGNYTANVNSRMGKFSIGDISPDTWLVLDPKDFELKPAESKEIFCRIKPPKDAEGELRARLYISGKEVGEGCSPIGLRFNMPVYVIVQNTIRLEAGIERIDARYSFKKGEIEGGILLDNKSNVHIRPEVSLLVKDLDGDLLGKIDVPFGQPAQKEEKRYFIFMQKMDIKPGKYKITANVDYGKFYGRKDYIATKEVGFEVKPPVVDEGKEKTEAESDVLEKTKGGE